jgi:hypothetical protein
LLNRQRLLFQRIPNELPILVFLGMLVDFYGFGVDRTPDAHDEASYNGAIHGTRGFHLRERLQLLRLHPGTELPATHLRLPLTLHASKQPTSLLRVRTLSLIRRTNCLRT